MRNGLAVLHVEDSPNDSELIARCLKRSNYELVFEQVETAAQMQEAITRREWDIIISDYHLPQFSAHAALSLLKDSGLDIPFLVVSGVMGEETAVAMMKAGAHDYIMKGNLARLIPAIERELGQAEVRKKHRMAENALRESEKMAQATVDALPAHLAILDNTGMILAVNRAWRAFALANAPSTDGLCEGVNYLAVCDAATGAESDDAHAIATGIRAVLRGDLQEYMLEYPCHSADEERWFSARATRFTQSNAIRIVLTHENITERKRVERRMETQFRRLSALREIDATIAGNRNLQLTLDSLLSHTTAQLSMDAASVLLFDPESVTLSCVAGYGFSTNIFLHDNLAGQLANEHVIQKIIHSPDLIHTHDKFQALWEAEGFRQYQGIPLAINGDVKGLLEVFHRSEYPTDVEWQAYLATLAEQFALAIDSAQLFANLEHSNRELSQAYNSAIEGWSRALDMRDKETDGHSQRVTEMTERLAQALGIQGAELQHIRWGALLHDIGKMGVPDAILLKPGPLTPEEWVLMKRHPELAYEMLSPITYLQQSLDIPFCHHEKWDGTGYPRGLKGEEIPLAARLFAVVDVWDALRSDRPYRPGWQPDRIIAHIQELSGSHFDPLATELFFRVIQAEYTLSS